jgi:hypothetical protein
MLVYGDRRERADASDCVQRLAADLRAVRAIPGGLERHFRIVALLIEAGRLLQGVADADFRIAGHDRRTAATEELTEFLAALGRAVCSSWAGRTVILPDPPGTSVAVVVDLREPEGFAFYAVYPEAYAEAARRVSLRGPPCVIGIRSIGTSLAAVAAAAVGAPTFVTVRPFGDPYARRIAIAPELERELHSQSAHYLIVDEGPGRSGSSFGAVAGWLRERGVPLDRITFLPSHAGEPGPHASKAHRELWARADKAVVDLAPRLPQLLADWASQLIGALDGPLVDISAGVWRAHVYRDEREWPAADTARERLKYLAHAQGNSWILKFAGLGSIGERKLAMARRLHEHGLAPEPRGLAHGFLIEPWHDDATRLTPADRPLAELAHYIGTRARLFPAAESDGASLHALLEMARRNVGLALGETPAEALDQWVRELPPLSARVRRVRTDNRLDPHEWLRLPDGTLLKSDALDHHQAHDLVGAQDAAWDVAGATVEFDLDPRETAWLAGEVAGAAGWLVDPGLLEFMTTAYAAFRLGQASLSADMADGDPAEQRRIAAACERYERRLRTLLPLQSHGSIPRKSAVGLAAERTA